MAYDGILAERPERVRLMVSANPPMALWQLPLALTVGLDAPVALTLHLSGRPLPAWYHESRSGRTGPLGLGPGLTLVG